MGKIKQAVRRTALWLLCAATALCMGLGGAGLFLKTSAHTVTNTYIAFNEPDSVLMGSSAPSYVYYDVDKSGTMNNEAYIYCNNRFNPSANNDAALIWTSPAAGTVNCTNGTIALNNAANRALSANTDGIRWSLLKVSANNECTALTDEFYNFLEFRDRERTVANFVINDLSIEQGEKIAIVIDCGEAGKNGYDEATLTVTLSFTEQDGGSTAQYAFSSAYLTAHGNAINNGTQYDLGVAATNYYSWGSSTFRQEHTITADVDVSSFTLTDVMNGKGEQELVHMAGKDGQWNISGEGSTYHVAITGSVAKIHAPTNLHDTQLVWMAPADGIFSLDSLTLNMADESGANVSDGMKYAVLYKNSEGDYYNIYTDNQITDDEPWHELEWKVQQEITSLPDFEMKSGEEFIVMFNRNDTATLDPCTFDIIISFAENNGETQIYSITQNTVKTEEQGINGFYFRDVYNASAVVYKNPDGTVFKTDNIAQGTYTLIGSEGLALNEDEQFVGWRNTANSLLYKAGQSYGLTVTSAEFTAVVITLKTEAGAGLRVSTELSDAGIRFVSTYNLSKLNEGEYGFGTIIALADSVTEETLFIKDGALNVSDIPAVNYKTEGEVFTQNAVINQIPEAQYNWELQSRGYVTVTYADDTAATFYTNCSDKRSVAYVAYHSYDALNEIFNLTENDALNNVVSAFKNAYITQEN